MIKYLNLISIFIFFSCKTDLPNYNNTYEEKLTVFANIAIQQITTNMYTMNVGTVHVSNTASITQDIQKEDLIIDNAEIVMNYQNLEGENITIRNCIDQLTDPCFLFDNNSNGYNLINDESLQLPALGDTVKLNVTHDNLSVSAFTILPNSLEVNSSDMSPYLCEGNEIAVDTVITDNFLNFGTSLVDYLVNSGTISIDSLSGFEFSNLYDLVEFNLLNNLDSVAYQNYKNFIIQNPTLSKIKLRDNGNCYIGSFASYPYFRIDFNSNANTSINIVNIALESDRVKSLHENGNNESGEDLNCNGIKGEGSGASYYQNLFYDYACQNESTFDLFKLWKDPITYDEQHRLRFTNPNIWLADTSPIPMMWLYFNYYGLQLINVQVVDQAYYDYFSGDPFVFNNQQNQFILPDSNIENGYGLFSSTLSNSFFIYLDRHPDNINNLSK